MTLESGWSMLPATFTERRNPTMLTLIVLILLAGPIYAALYFLTIPLQLAYEVVQTARAQKTVSK